jgi:hypothetical protein
VGLQSRQGGAGRGLGAGRERGSGGALLVVDDFFRLGGDMRGTRGTGDFFFVRGGGSGEVQRGFDLH